jgi:hypothetical protein
MLYIIWKGGRPTNGSSCTFSLRDNELTSQFEFNVVRHAFADRLQDMAIVVRDVLGYDVGRQLGGRSWDPVDAVRSALWKNGARALRISHAVNLIGARLLD